MMPTDKRSRTRIDWIDFAKGISIIGTIVSHTTRVGSLVHNLLFSFHMPLFFVLSGYTMTPATDRETLLRKIKKDAKVLLPPVIIFSAIRSLGLFVMAGNFSSADIVEAISMWANSIFWSSGVEENGRPALGMLWFLVSMFTARSIINIIHTIFKEDKDEVIPLVLGCAGIILGSYGHYLPFNLDVSLASIFFLSIGLIAKKKVDQLRKHSSIILIAASLVWLYCIYQEHAIEIAARSYGINTLDIVEAICASYVVIRVCMQVSRLNLLKKPLVFIGMNSLYVLCFHNIDFLTEPLWNLGNNILTYFSRVLSVIALSSLFVIIRQILDKRKRLTDLQLLRLIVLTMLNGY